MAQQVAVQFEDGGEFMAVELVSTNRGWATVLFDGEERKVRISKVAMGDDDQPVEDLTDEDDDEDRVGGDVFPSGYRETYAQGTTEDGVKYIDNGDALAQKLRGASLHEVAALAQEIVQEPKMSAQAWIDLYTVDREAMGKDPLNNGMVRMNIGNRIRAAIKRAEQEAA